jgi:hypothetical protein
MKLQRKGYWKPTPKKIRKIADSLLAATTFGATMTVLNGMPVLGTILFVIGVVAKFVSNFVAEDETPQDEVQ